MTKKIILPVLLIIISFILLNCNLNKTPSTPDTTDKNVIPSNSPTNNITTIPTLTFTATLVLTITPDQYEEDDTPNQSKLINASESHDKSIDACNEYDWVKFILSDYSDIELTTNSLYPTYIECFADENKNNFIKDAGDGSNAANLIINNLQPGTYYAGVRAYNYDTPGCDIFNYTLSLSVYVHTATPILTETFTQTETHTLTFTPTFTPTFTITSTQTEFLTSTFTNSFTPSFTPTYDSYEYDDTTHTAKPITNDETQFRNFWEYNTYDFISFYIPETSNIYVSITTTANYNFAIFNHDASTVWHPIYGFLTFNKIGNFYFDVVLSEGNYFFGLIGYEQQATDYSINFSYITCSPTNTFTNTETKTPTSTDTFTFTETFTITNTPTQTPTGHWQEYSQYGFNNSGYLSMDENGSNFSLSYMSAGTLYVDSGYNVTNSSEGSFLASRDMIKKLTNKTLVVFSDSNAYIYVKSSEDNFNNPVGTQSAGRGYYPCIESNGTTIYVAYTDIEGGSDMRTSVKLYSPWYNWTYYGGDGGVYNQADTQQRRLSIDGYFSALNNDIYIGYITNGNSGIQVKHNVNDSGWQQVGTSVISSANIRDVEIAVIDPSNIFCAFSTNSPDFKIYVKKYESGNWIYAGTNPVATTATAGNVEFSIYAVTPYEVYLAFQEPVTAKAVVKKYNGTDWEYLGDQAGISQSNISNPNIFKLLNKVYCGFIDSSKSGVINIMIFE